MARAGWKKFRRIFWLSALGIVLVAAAAVTLYVMYLDRIVTKQFEGRRWTLPAQVYAAPLELYASLPLTGSDLEHELQRLQYRRVDKLEHPVSPLGARAGSLTPQAAAWTGLPAGIAVAVGNVDAHVTPPAADAIAPGQMVAIMGTSTCHVMNGAALVEVPGMCGVVDGGIVAGRWGYEAGQSGVGDIFAWFTDHAVPAGYSREAARRGISLFDLLSEEAASQPAGAHGLMALDWLNGNRSVLVDHHLSGAVLGLTLATRAPDIYRALVESTAFGTRVIIDAFDAAGVPVTELVIAGGLMKDSFVMQVYADVLRRPLSLIASTQGPALGSAIHAAVAAGAYPDVPAAAAAMGSKHDAVYTADPGSAAVYDDLYAEYARLHDYFGRGANEVMHRLRDLRDRVLKGGQS